ncbi:hypothetical protein [Halococcus sp. IIIV-5B]|uniref:hypothetical protein n=1 Tax=Halococcus sp. IIIV-5B TaxID=2321230 RepID=UPI0011C3769B|nr:hypothetical protein [Halococcus sp. IIIV-5B]
MIVTDDRVMGAESWEKIGEYRFESDDDHCDRRKEAVGEAFDDAIAWMEGHGSEWSHPRINETGFQPPAGYELTRYSIGSRETIILYHQVDAPDVNHLCGIQFPELTVDSSPTWKSGRGSAAGIRMCGSSPGSTPTAARKR